MGISIMEYFIGEYEHNLDSKSRLAIPAKFRSKLGVGAVITRGLDRCLFLFSEKDWEALAEKIVSLPLAQSNSRAFARLMLSGAMNAELDQQGRILIPDYLRNYAGIQKETVVAGLYNRIEIWDAKIWQDYKTKTEASSDAIAEKMGEFGI